MVCHEPKMDQMKRQAKRHEHFTRRARGRSGEDQRCPGLGCGLPHIRFCFSTPSTVSADPVDPPFGTLPILTNHQLSVPTNIFESSRHRNHGAGTRHDFLSRYPSLTIHTALFSCPKRTNLPHTPPPHSLARTLSSSPSSRRFRNLYAAQEGNLPTYHWQSDLITFLFLSLQSGLRILILLSLTTRPAHLYIFYLCQRRSVQW